VNKIEELIQELCPEGVPYAPMGTVCKVFNGYAFKSELFNSLGDGVPLVRIRDLNTGLSGTFYSGEFDESYVVHDKDILIGMDGSFIPIRWKHGRALLNQRVCRIQDFSSDVVGDFLFYILKIELQTIEDNTQLSTVKHLSSRQLVDLRVPLPPLRVQQEIVSILDKFTELEAELEAELDARTKQYESYRARALDLSRTREEHPYSGLIQELCPDGVQYFALQDVFEMKNGYTPSKSNPNFWNNGSIPWFRMDDIRAKGRVLNKSTQMVAKVAVKSGSLFEANSVILATSATIGEHALITVPFLANQRFTVLTVREKYQGQVLPKFTFYMGFELSRFCLENTNVSGFASVDMDKLRGFSFPVPPLEIQERIVSLLDRFSDIVSSSTDGLPAEIQARRKQYEYYRNKLLTFKELDAA
jgi:type I restriction enzyme S subunit